MKSQNGLKRLGFRRRLIHYFLLNLARLIFAPVPLKVYGKENIPPERVGTLFVSNHLSHIDSVITAVAAFPVKRAIRFAGAKDFMEKLYFKWTKYELAFPVGRGKGEREKFIQTAVTILKDGGSVGIYPEGRRSRSGRFESAKIGAGWIAKLAGPKMKVVPVYVNGTNHLLPIGNVPRLNIRQPLKVYFGPPLDLSSYYTLPDSAETSKMILGEMIRGIHRQEQLYKQKEARSMKKSHKGNFGRKIPT
ncbi:MAG: lysophospholipid acyltransferase family protein [Candidatus Hodarchaeota archaeon]